MENRTGKVILIKTELMNDYLRVDLDDQYYGSSKKDGIRCESLKHKVLHYLRVPRSERSGYFFAKLVSFENSRKEVIVGEQERI